jgi:hypothetical protein
MCHFDWKARVVILATGIANEYTPEHQKAGNNHVEM